MNLDFNCVWQYWPFLYHGALMTVKMTAICAVLGFLLGVLLSLVKISKSPMTATDVAHAGTTSSTHARVAKAKMAMIRC